MTRPAKHLSIPILVTFVLSSACSSDPDINPADYCGDNTTLNADTGKCDGEAPVDPVDCAEGTQLVENECVPDGSVICTEGTTFNPDTGTCEPDLTGCGPGTVEVDGECVTEDSQLMGMADVVEAPDGSSAEFTLPELNSNTYLYGCSTPTEDADGPEYH